MCEIYLLKEVYEEAWCNVQFFSLFVCLEHNWMEVVVEKCMDIMFLTLLKCSHAVGKLV